MILTIDRGWFKTKNAALEEKMLGRGGKNQHSSAKLLCYYNMAMAAARLRCAYKTKHRSPGIAIKNKLFKV